MAMGRVFVASVYLLAAGLLAGCNLQPTATTETQQSTGQISGRAMGGSQPIINSTVQLYTVGTTSDGSAASPLGSSVTTGSGGSFQLGSYTCPSSTTLVYITASGGNPGTGTNNSAINLMAALGQCGTLSSSTFIVLNELTTVSAVYALSSFMTSSTTVGSAYIDSLSLSAGFSLASYYGNYATGTSPGTNVPSNATVPSTQINTIADALAACVNSSGNTSTNCNTLFTATTIGGVTPTTVLSAALNLALYPTSISTQNTNSIYGLISASSPYQPYDSPAPANWSVALATVSSTPLLATGDSRTVTQPVTPTTICATLSAQFTSSAVDVASPPTSDDTTNIQSALNSCSGNGAVVLASSGSNNAFLAGPLTIKANESLIVNSGVTLYANDSVYTANSQFIYIPNSNTGIYGPGTIDGRAKVTTSTNTPRLVESNGASNVIFYNLTLQNAAFPNLYIQGGNGAGGATVWDVTILTNPNQNQADGIDIDSITNVTVNNSLITAGDDGVAVKTNESNSSNITVENNRLYGTHGLTIGSIKANTVTNVLFQNNYVYGDSLSTSPFGVVASTTANGVNIKVDPCALTVTQVTYLNTCVTQSRYLVVMNTNYGSCTPAGTPVLNDIVVNGLTSTSSVFGAYSNLYGYSSSDPIVAYFANVKLDKNTLDPSPTPQYGNYSLDNVNGFTPAGTGVTNSTFTLNGTVPSCAF